MLRQLSAALIAASMIVAPALAADTTKAPVAPAQAAAPDGTTVSTAERTDVAKQARHRHLRTAAHVHHHKHARYAAAHRKHVRHVVHARHPKPTAQVGPKPVVAGEPAAKAATPANRTN
jgi:hypothetical protein